MCCYGKYLVIQRMMDSWIFSQLQCCHVDTRLVCVFLVILSTSRENMCLLAMVWSPLYSVPTFMGSGFLLSDEQKLPSLEFLHPRIPWHLWLVPQTNNTSSMFHPENPKWKIALHETTRYKNGNDNFNATKITFVKNTNSQKIYTQQPTNKSYWRNKGSSCW